MNARPRQNDEHVDQIINVPLPTDKPLWQIHLLPAAEGAEQKDCVLFRSHHTIGDGISLVGTAGEYLVWKLYALCVQIQLLDAVAVSRDGGPITYVNPKEKKPIKMSFLTKLVYGVLFSLEWVSTGKHLLWKRELLVLGSVVDRQCVADEELL